MKEVTQMKILKMYPESMNTRERFMLTAAPNMQKMQSAVDSEMEVAAYALYEDVNRKDGTVNEVLTVMTPDGEIFATVSPTFKEDFFRIADFFCDAGETIPAIKVLQGTSKSGRSFIYCTIA